MNSRERVMAVLSAERPDRPAYAMTLSLYGARLTDCPLPVYFSDPLSYVRGQVAVLERFAPDVLFGPFAFASLGAAFGSSIREFSDQAPTIRRPACERPQELGNILFPDPDEEPNLQYHLNAIRNLAEECGKETPIAAILPLPIDLPALFMGMEAWMETVLFDPDGMEQVIDLMVPFTIDFANRLFAEGADFIVSPCAFSSPTLVTRDIARKFARPVLERTLRGLRGPVVIHHGGAPVLAHLDLLCDLPSVIGYVVDARDCPADAREIIGPDKILFGGPDNHSIAGMSAEKVEQCCRSILEDRASDPRFVLCNSGPDLPLQTPPENIDAFRKTTGRDLI